MLLVGLVVVASLDTSLDNELLVVVDKLALLEDVLELVEDVDFLLECEALSVVDALADIAEALLVDGGRLLLHIKREVDFLVVDSLEGFWLEFDSLEVVSPEVDSAAI